MPEDKPLEEKPLNEKKNADILKHQMDFVALQIHAKFTYYPMPKVT